MDNKDTEDTIIVSGSGNDIDFSNLVYSIDITDNITLPNSWNSLSGNVTMSNTAGSSSSQYTITTSGSSGPYLYSTGALNPATWNTPGSGLKVHGDSEFEGDVKVRGRSLEKMFQKIEDRLAILQDPDPAKLEKYAALKKAYDHYRTLERLIGDD